MSKSVTPGKKLNILFITQDDPFYVRLFFEEFFKAFNDLATIKGVVVAAAMGKKGPVQLARQMYDFYGPLDFVRVGTRYASYKVKARIPALAGGNFYSIGQLCAHHGVPVFSTNRVNSPEFLASLREMDLDLIASVAAPVIFKKELVELPRLGCINIHNGALPRYRGMLPNFWQMYHNERQVGITIHEMNEKLDDGRILRQEMVDILPGETLDSLIRRTKSLGAHVMARAIASLRDGTASYRENPATEGSYFSFPTKDHVREFKQNGKRLI